MYEFRWNAWNIEHIAAHGVSANEAEYVVNHASKPFPRKVDDDKFLVLGQTNAGEYIQVAYIIDEDLVFVIHARPLTENEKRRLRRRRPE